MVYAKRFTTLQDMNCDGEECDTQLSIPATMIPNEIGLKTKNDDVKIFARFQTTPSDNFFFGIDGQGKVEETGWFLYPSMRFMAYQAQWWVQNTYKKNAQESSMDLLHWGRGWVIGKTEKIQEKSYMDNIQIFMERTNVHNFTLKRQNEQKCSIEKQQQAFSFVVLY